MWEQVGRIAVLSAKQGRLGVAMQKQKGDITYAWRKQAVGPLHFLFMRLFAGLELTLGP